MWIELTSQTAIDDFLADFAGFHDSCLREVSLATETFINERRAMSCPGHLDTSALLFFQSQFDELSAIELRCTGISHLRLRPTAENCDSIVSGASLTLQDGRCRLAIRFIGGPLVGPPNTGIWLPAPSTDGADFEVVARSMEWRPLNAALGNRLRYRAADQ